jgi:glutathione S-transferase
MWVKHNNPIDFTFSGSCHVNHLYSIPFSHYNEQARWVLDYHHVPYREHKYLPGYHMLPLMWAKKGKGKSDRISTKYSTPCLVRENSVLQDSVEIMLAIDQENGDSLFSPPGILKEEVQRQVLHYHDYLGPHTRRLAYHYLLDDPKVFVKLARKNVGAFQSLSLPLVFGAFKAFISKGLGVTPERAQKSNGYILQELEQVEQTLVDGRPFLCGKAFSAADIAFSSMLAPVLLPSVEEGYGGVLPSLSDTHGDFAEFVNHVRASRGGQHALAMFTTLRRKEMGA